CYLCHRDLLSFPTRRSSDLAKAPFLLPPPWSTYLAVSLNTLSMGTIPLLVPLVPLMYEPVALTLWILKPIPPALCEIFAVWPKVDRKSTRLNSSHVKISYAV